MHGQGAKQLRSFTRETIRNNPLALYAHKPDVDQVPTLGLLHGDLGQPNSPYAPIALEDLQRLPVSAWLLGHIHRPAVYERDGCPLVFYPGSPLAMDPGEKGVHGVWLMQVHPGCPVAVKQIPISRVRYDELTIDLNDVDDEQVLHRRIPDGIRSYLQSLPGAVDGLRYVCLRLVLTGRTKLHRNLRDVAEQVRQQIRMDHESVTVCVEDIDLQTRPAIDLDALATGKGPTAALAKTVLALQGAELDESHRQLLRETLRRWDAHLARTDNLLNRDRPADEHQTVQSERDEKKAREILIRQGYRLLDELQSQLEDA